MNHSDDFSLGTFERLAYGRKREEAALELIKLVRYLDLNYGHLGPIGDMQSGEHTSDDRDAHFAARIASAVGSLFADPEFHLTEEGFLRLISLHQWFAIIFGASAFGTADHLIQLFNTEPDPDRQLTLKDKDLLKFCLLYSPDSGIPVNLEVLWDKSKRLAATLFLALLSCRLTITAPAHDKRERLLNWLPSRLKDLSLDELPLDLVHTVWMLCSYAVQKDKHAIKKSLNQLIRNKLLALRINDLPKECSAREKPVVLCITEWFLSTHSIYRTHSLSLEALKNKYRVVGVSLKAASDDVTRRVFDEVHVIPPEQSVLDSLKQVHELAATVRPDLVYYPSVGMFHETIFLVNVRLAPIQMVGLGHPATTHSPFIDYVLVEEDYLGDPKCFSESIVALPAEAMPYRLPANCPSIKPAIRPASEQIRVAVPASLIKINAVFLSTLRRIAEQSRTPVRFQFFSLGALGLAKVYLQNVVQRFLPGNVVVYPYLPYEQYIQKINTCDMFVNPFPFGNTNGIVDTVRQGIPGVCLTGPEVHSHIDEGLFRRIGLPDWLITKTTDEYVSAAVRLAENAAEREELSKMIQQANVDSVLLKGNPELFARSVEWLRATHETQGARPPGSVVRPPFATAPKDGSGISTRAGVRP